MNDIYKEELDIPILENIPNYIEFNGNSNSVEVFINKHSFGIYKIDDDIDKFISDYLFQIAKANNYDTSYLAKRLEELNEKKSEVKYLKAYYTDELKYIYNIEQNIIKKTCKELGLTYAQLAEQIGYTEGALKTSVSTDKVSNSMIKAIELYRKNLELEEKLLNSEKIKETLKEWLK
jgi:hypothetical protein